MSEQPLLECKSVVRRFAGMVAVDHVSIAVRDGELLGIIGPNGAGKTTLFNACAGLVRASSGSVELFGRDMTRSSVVLPAPFGPMTPRTCRGGTASETASSAVSPPKRTVTFCTSRTEPGFTGIFPRHDQQEVPV